MFKPRPTKKIILITLLASTLFFLYDVKSAQAGIMDIIGDILGLGLTAVGAITSTPILIALTVLGYFLAVVSSFILILSGLLTGIANYLQTFIISPNNQIVFLGWTIVRDIANLGFVLLIIIIAFAIILRLEQYQIQKSIPKLIAAAILVNFSLEINKIIINSAQVLTNFFTAKITAQPWMIAYNILASFGPQRFIKGLDFSSFADGLTAFNSAVIGIVAAPYFMSTFNLIMAFVMFVLGFMLLIRFIYLSILTIISPIIWLFWAIPGQASQLNTKWWSKFIEWTFFAPIVSFFLSITFVATQNIKTIIPPQENFQNALSGLSATISELFFAGTEVIILCGLLIASLMIAQSMSIVGAKGAMDLVDKAGKAAKGWALKQGIKAGTRPFRGERGQEFVNKMQTLGQNKGFLVRNVTAPFRQIGVGLAAFSRKGEELAEKEREKIKDLSFKQKARMYAAAPNERKAAILKDFAEERKAVENEKENADERVKRAKEKLEASEKRLAEKRFAKTTTPKEIAEAEKALEKAQQELDEATENQQKVKKKYDKFYKEFLDALNILPDNVRQAFQAANYDLNKLEIPKKTIIRTKLIPLPYLYGERGEYKGGNIKK